MSAIEILQRARQLIANESGWTQGTFARNKKNKPCWTMKGVRFCAAGARLRAAYEMHLMDSPAFIESRLLLDKAAFAIAHANGAIAIVATPTMVNDKLGHAAVLRMYDLAIEAALAKETTA